MIKNAWVGGTDGMRVVGIVEQDGKKKDTEAAELRVPDKHTGTGKGG